MGKRRTRTAVLLLLFACIINGLTVWASGSSPPPEKGTIISADEETAVRQLAELIPDENFRREIVRSLAYADQLGDPSDPTYAGLTEEERYKAVLQNFTGTLYASGYVKRITYSYSFSYVLFGTSQTYKGGPFTSREEALDDMKKMMEMFLALPNTTVDESSGQVTGQMETTGEKKPEQELIRSIEGIQWLRRAGKIDLSFNRITDLSPLDSSQIRRYIAEPDEAEAAEQVKRWFGEPGRNTVFSFEGNGITVFPAYMAGRMDIVPDFIEGSLVHEEGEAVTVKEKEAPWPVQIRLELPAVTVGGQAIHYAASDLDIPEALNTLGSIRSEYENSSGQAASVLLSGIRHSGEVTVTMGTAEEHEEDVVRATWYKANDITDRISEYSCGITVSMHQVVRIYSPVEPADPDMQIRLHKTAEGGEGPVPGAVYQLYEARRSEAGYEAVRPWEYQDSAGHMCTVSGTTDENGTLTVSCTLPAGTYCLVETKSPPGYEKNPQPSGFTVGAVMITGGDHVEGKQGVYIDRYSRNVSLELDPACTPENTVLTGVNVVYETGEGSTETKAFSGEQALSEAQSFINTGKGSDGEPGVILGTVSVLPVFESDMDTKDLQKTAEFNFSKLGTDQDGNGSPDPLAGAEFTLSCRHDHQKEDQSFCTDLHIQMDPSLKGEGCGWIQKAVSGADGTVHFEKLTAGTYLLKETKAPDGFQNTDMTWTVSVKEDKNGVLDISVESNDIKGECVRAEKFQVVNKPLLALCFTKIDGISGKEGIPVPVSGAEFALYHAIKGENGVWEKGEIAGRQSSSSEQNEKGKVRFEGLTDGTYILEETKPPGGYVKPSGYWIVRADAGKSAELQVKIEYRPGPDEHNEALGEVLLEDGSYYIKNYTAGTLPAAGGTGTAVYTAAGLLLAAAGIAAVFWLQRTEERKEKGGSV